MTTALVPLHFLEELRPAAGELGVRLAGYDKNAIVLEETSAEILFRWWITPDQCDALIRAHPLRWIHSGSAGVDHVLTPTFLSSDILLTNSAGVHAISISEWVVAAMLLVTKDLPRMLEQQRKRIWDKIETPELVGARVVFLGAGHIAHEIAARLRPFGAHLVAVRRRMVEDPLFDERFPVERIKEALNEADWLLVTAPLTESTRHLVDRDVLAALPSRARLVNVARGEIIEINALTAAIRERRIAGAVLDVFEQEPLPPDDPLWTLPGVIILPHTTWRSPDVHRREVELFLDNLGRWRRGEKLRNVVDRAVGY